MRAPLRLSVLLALFILLPACSLTGIDQVEATPCATTDTGDLSEAHATCRAELGGTPLGDCEAYVCGREVDGLLFCTVGTPDLDGDGVGDAACVPEGTEALRDCDDSDPEIAEGRPEVCDGKDNNCDGRTDEDVFVVSDPDTRDSSDGAAAGDVLDMTAVGNQVVAAFRRESSSLPALHLLEGAVPGVIDRPGGATGPVVLEDALEDTDRGIAVAGDPSTLFAVFPAAGCAGLSAGSVGGGELTSDAFTAMVGLPSTAAGDRACSDDVQQRAPAAAIAGDDVVLAWLESGSRAGCGLGVTAPLVVTTTTPDAPLSAPATNLGTANDAGPPALLALNTADTFILAHGEGDEAVVTSLRVNGAGVEVLGTLRLALGATVEELALTEGPTRGDDVEFAVAFSAGCGRLARVGLSRIRLTPAGGALSRVGEPTLVDEGSWQDDPAVAFGADFPRGYFIVWREGDERVRGQLLGETEGTSGTAVDVIGAEDVGGAPRTRIRGPGVAARTEGGFNTLAYVAGPETGFFAALVSCGTD